MTTCLHQHSTQTATRFAQQRSCAPITKVKCLTLDCSGHRRASPSSFMLRRAPFRVVCRRRRRWYGIQQNASSATDYRNHSRHCVEWVKQWPVLHLSVPPCPPRRYCLSSSLVILDYSAVLCSASGLPLLIHFVCKTNAYAFICASVRSPFYFWCLSNHPTPCLTSLRHTCVYLISDGGQLRIRVSASMQLNAIVRMCGRRVLCVCVAQNNNTRATQTNKFYMFCVALVCAAMLTIISTPYPWYTVM